MIGKAYKPWKPDRAGKNYRPKETNQKRIYEKVYILYK